MKLNQPMKLKSLCPKLSASELKSLNQKMNLLVDFVFGKDEKKKVCAVNKKGEKKITGMRPIRPVKIFNRVYGSMTIAADALNMSLGTISRRCASTEYKDRNFSFIEPPKQKTI